MHRGSAALVILLVVAACGGSGADTTEPSQFPTGSVRSWFDSLEADDMDTAQQLTYQESMLIVLAAENAMPTEELATLLRRGATEESAARYLAGFSDALRARYGGSLAAITVDGFTQLGGNYAAVAVTGDGAATIIARKSSDGLWQVDLVGTLGPALISQIGDLLDAAGADSDGATVRDAYRINVVPALEAAAAHDPENFALAAEIREILSVLGS